MIRVFFLVASIVLSYLPFIHSATDHSTSMPICTESFSCPNLGQFNYPFYNATDDKQCGLIQVNCTLNGGKIQLGRDSYEIVAKYVSDLPTVTIRNTTFEGLVNNGSCKALMDNFTSPRPLLYSMWIAPFITLYKCTNHPNYVEEINDYFQQSNYNKKTCEDDTFYYNYSISDTAVPSHLPLTCQVIHLPVKVGEPREHRTVLNETNIFSLLSPRFSIYFLTSCDKCQLEGGRCHALNGQFQSCLYAKTETPPTKLKRILGATLFGLSC